jgi:hypothetical protein
MRKFKMISLALMAGLGSLAMSPVANALEFPNGNKVTVALCTIGGVPILSTDVTVNFSKNVTGGYQCRVADATAGTVNRVMLGTCHTGGTSKSRQVTCTRTSDGADPPVYSYSPATCSASNFSVPATPTAVPVNGGAYYTTSTAGGVIGEDGLETVCTGAALSGKVEALLN